MSKSCMMLAAAIAVSIIVPIAQAVETPARIVGIAAERGELRVAFVYGR